MKFFAKLFITIAILFSSSAQLHCWCPWPFSWFFGSNNDTLPALKNEAEYIKAKEDLQTLYNSRNGYFQGIASYMKDCLELEARWNSIEQSIIESCTKNKSAKCRECFEQHLLSDNEEGALYKEFVDAYAEFDYFNKQFIIYSEDNINTFPLGIRSPAKEKLKAKLQKYQEEVKAKRDNAVVAMSSRLPKNIVGGTYLGAISAFHSKIVDEANFLIQLEIQKKLHVLSTDIDKKTRQIEEYEKKYHTQPETVES
jgi:hypothetical protein